MLRVRIETENDAFSGDGEREVARLLRALAIRVEAGEVDGVIRDINGNRCGAFDLRIDALQEEDADA